MSDPSCSIDERFVLLKERIQALERKIDSKPGGGHLNHLNHTNLNHTFAKPHTPTLSGLLNSNDSQATSGGSASSSFGSKDEYRRAQKLKKEHRKTRVIRLNPSEGSLLNITNNRDDSGHEGHTASSNMLGELSPYSQAMRAIDLEATPADDKTKDPDWANTPVGGLGTKKKRQTISKRV